VPNDDDDDDFLHVDTGNRFSPASIFSPNAIKNISIQPLPMLHNRNYSHSHSIKHLDAVDVVGKTELRVTRPENYGSIPNGVTGIFSLT
jgi:hypothetical protein